MGYNAVRVAIIISLAVVGLVATKICEMTRNSTEIRTHSSSILSKIIAYWKRISNFLLVINSNFRGINVKKTYQFKTHCKHDVMISLH